MMTLRGGSTPPRLTISHVVCSPHPRRCMIAAAIIGTSANRAKLPRTGVHLADDATDAVIAPDVGGAARPSCSPSVELAPGLANRAAGLREEIGSPSSASAAAAAGAASAANSASSPLGCWPDSRDTSAGQTEPSGALGWSLPPRPSSGLSRSLWRTSPSTLRTCDALETYDTSMKCNIHDININGNNYDTMIVITIMVVALMIKTRVIMHTVKDSAHNQEWHHNVGGANTDTLHEMCWKCVALEDWRTPVMGIKRVYGPHCSCR